MQGHVSLQARTYAYAGEIYTFIMKHMKNKRLL